MQLIEDSYSVPQNQEHVQAPEKPKKENQPITIGDWFLTLFVTAIPLVGFIMLLVWIFSNNTNPNKANWAKALMIWKIIGFLLVIIFWVTMGAVIIGALNSYR